MDSHRKTLNLSLLLSISLAFHVSNAVSGADSDKSALLEFKSSVLDPSGVLITWNLTNSDLCSWVGVSTGSNYRVVAVNITGAGNSGSFAKLIGKLSSAIVAIAKLSEIRVLSLPFNGLRGEIPVEIWGIKKLEVIDLEGNMISGKLNSNFMDLNNLRVINLGFNQISGELPENLLNLTNLTVILLNNNKLSGPIPSGFTNTARMLRFNVSGNKFSGPLARSLMAAKPGTASGGDLVNYSDSSNPAPKSGARRFNKIEIASITLASAFVSVLLALIVLYLCAQWRPKPKPVAHGPVRKEVTLFTNIGFGLDFDAVIRATGNFNASNCIGNGGFGATYRAEISPWFVVAIKRLAVGRCQGIQQFEAEIKTLGRHRHRNLVTLIGYHASETEMFLIYNYLPGGNLERFIQERSTRAVDWQVLHKIALDVARALMYLHDQCVPRVLHRDVKPSNILLDVDLNAYLSDFGLARLLGTSETHATTGVAGTFGYVAPEYAMTCRVSDKADVYSYGVVLLELLSDKKALDPSFSCYGNGFNIVGWALMLLEEGRAKEFFTAGLWDAGPHDDLVEVLHLAVVCTTDSLSTRPAMQQVVRQLMELQSPSPL